MFAEVNTTAPVCELTEVTAEAAWLNEITPVLELYARSPPADIADLAKALVKYKFVDPCDKSSVS